MHWNQLTEVAWVGDQYVNGPIRGIQVFFHGLGGAGMKEGPTDEERFTAEHGVLHLFPYYGPWSWMNREARAFVDDLIAEAYRVFALPAETPLFINGGSMGGCSALLYTCYSKHSIAGVIADCPVCDVPFHFTERPDLPRTMYHAFGAYAGDWQVILEEHSPLHQVAAMPDVPYFIVHGDADTAVNKALHSDKMVAAMRARNLRLEYHELPGSGHCAPWPAEVVARGREFVLSRLHG